MEVKLMSYTPDPELLSAAAARVCYRDVSAVDILNNLSSTEVNHLLDTVISSGHHSVIEHVTFTFAIDNVSRVLTHQLVRHRVGIAFSQQSQRYTDVNDAGYVIPQSIAQDADLNTKYEKAVGECFALYEELQRAGVPNEDARFVLPQATATRLVMTVNLRQLIHMYAINACFRSQWEFRQLMRKVKHEMRKAAPRLAQELKIKCFSVGYCEERAMCEELKGKMPRKIKLLAGERRYTPDYYRDLAAQVGETL